MLYCKKCRCLTPDGAARCQNCRSNKLRAADGEDLVFLHRADQYTAEKLCGDFSAAGLVYEAKPLSQGLAAPLYDSEAMPTDKILYVRLADLEQAEEFSRRRKAELDAENQTEEFQDMPRRKRIIVQTVSVIAFLVLVMLTVFAADAAAEWLKRLLGL